MTRYLAKFRRDEDGAVTVDWVVLTAAIVLLGAVAGSMIGYATKASSDNLGSHLEAQNTMTYN